MNRLNVDLNDDFSQVSMFTTAFIGIINQSNLTISYCNAGQSPIIYVPANQKPVLLEANDIPIGIFDGYEFSTSDLQLSKDDIFVVASDGFPESRDPSGEMYGYTRLLNYFSDSRHLSAQQIVENLMAEINNFSGSHPQDDDCTIIVIKIR